MSPIIEIAEAPGLVSRQDDEYFSRIVFRPLCLLQSKSRGARAAAEREQTLAIVGGSSNIHEGSRPFYQTPQLIRAKPPPLDAANQADELSRK